MATEEAGVADTSIEWTDVTWNPVAGCSIVTAGCTNCYAMRMAARLEAMGVEKYVGLTRKSGGRAKWTGAIKLDPELRSIPIVVLTSSHAPRDQERSYDLDADHYVTKPIGLDVLAGELKIIEALAGRRRS